MNQPLVTIIIPVYKVEKYLRRCLDSIAAQTYTNFEVILIDDGSPDRCGEICDAYAAKDARFRVIHQENRGVSAARNAGLDDYFKRKKKGYIFFADSDDYLMANTLEILVVKALEGSFDIVMAGYYEIERDGARYWRSASWENITNAEEIQKNILLDKLPNFPWGKLFTANLWEYLRFPEKRRMEDLYLIPRVFFYAKRVCLIRAPLYFYNHENEESSMNNWEISHYIRLRYDWFLAWEEHEKLAAQYAPECHKECVVQALHKAVRVGLMNQSVKVLSDEEYETIVAYLRQHKNIPVKMGLHIGRRLLLSDSKLKYIVGYIQCWDVIRREKRKSKK